MSPLQAGQLQLGQAVPPGAEEVPGAPEFQVLLGDDEAVVGGCQGPQALAGWPSLALSERRTQ